MFGHVCDTDSVGGLLEALADIESGFMHSISASGSERGAVICCQGPGKIDLQCTR